MTLTQFRVNFTLFPFKKEDFRGKSHGTTSANIGLNMGLDKSRNQSEGFTMVEMLTVIAIIAILAALLLPVLSKAQMRAKRIWCENNLSQQGIAFHNFAHDHNSKFPMAVPMADGGSLEFTENGYLINGAFYFSFHHFQTLSNLLVTPKLVVCPTDTRVAAANFETMQNSNLSYFVGANADYFQPATILAGDGNLVPTSTEAPTIIYDNAGARLQWTRELHQFKGNVLFADAHVEEWGDAGGANSLADAENFILPTIKPVTVASTYSPFSPASPAPGAGNSSSGFNPATPSTGFTPPSQPSQPSQPNQPNQPGQLGQPSQPSQPAPVPTMPPHNSGMFAADIKKTAADNTTVPDLIQFSNNIAKTNLIVVSVTNDATGIPEPLAVSHPKPNLMLKIVGWSFLLLLLLLLLLLFLAYQIWQASRKDEQKKRRR